MQKQKLGDLFADNGEDEEDWASEDDSGADPAEKAQAVAAAEKAWQQFEVKKARQAAQRAAGALTRLCTASISQTLCEINIPTRDVQCYVGGCTAVCL